MQINHRWDGEFEDQLVPDFKLDIEPIWQGKVIRVQREKFEIFGIEAAREVVAHPGAVGVIAVNKENEIALIRQYRQPVRSFLFEPIAGLLDQPGENPITGAQRELLEEAGLLSENWSHLVDLVVSPGGSTEVIRFYLAEEAKPAPGGRTWSAEAEEKEMPLVWVNEQQFVTAVLSGKIHNSVGISAIFTAFAKLKEPSRENPDKNWPLFDLLASSGGLGLSPLS